MADDVAPKIRSSGVHPEMPAEHMRIIGEICVYWTAMEWFILQAVCETLKLGDRVGLYLGQNVPSGTRIEMLQAVAQVLKASDDHQDHGKELLKLLEPIRAAYLLRNKYAHALLGTYGPDKDPWMRSWRATKRIEIDSRAITLTEMKADADAIFDACEALTEFFQSRGFCKKAWL